MLSELKFAARTLPRSPGFALAAIGALALGIGANTVIFSAVNAILLNPAGMRDPGRLVAARVKYDKLNLKNISISAWDYAEVRDSAKIVARAALMTPADYSYTGGDMPERLVGAQVSWQWFDVFGVKPMLGRDFRAEEDQPGANHVVMLSYTLWRRLFGADATIPGKTIQLNQETYRVTGVIGPEFRWPPEADLWVPIGLAPAAYGPDNAFNESYFTVARLRPGVSFEQANAYVQLHAQQVVRQYDAGGRYAQASGWGMFLQPFTVFMAGDFRTPLLVLLGAVVFVLLIACSNIAGLMLARGSGRARELAIRAALGAGRWRLIRQTLAEATLLAFCGCLLGLLLAWLGVRVLVRATQQLGTPLAITMDGWVLLFTAAAGAAAGLLFAAAPAWQASRADHYAVLKEGGRSGTGSERQRLRGLLVAGEVALAMVLLAGAGLFLRSLWRLQQVNTGFEPRGVMTGSLALAPNRYKEEDRQVAFYQAVVERLRALPGARTAALAQPLPFSGNDWSASFQIEGRVRGPGDPGPHGAVRYVSPEYFAALGIPLRRGRVFTGQDRRGGEPVAVIDENLARQYWPNADPVGRRIGRGGNWARIVGVVAHIKHSELAADSGKGVYYFPIYQKPVPLASLVVRTGANPAALDAAIREAVRAVDGSQPVYDLKTMEQRVEKSLGPRRFAVGLLGLFAALALVMAAVGLYGLLSYAVEQRTHEIGVRMALGAERGRVLAMVVGQGIRLALIGGLIGAAGAFALARVLASQLFQVSALDVPAFAAAAVALSAVALLATYVPARRATRVDPIVALRYE